ncbi:MAG: protein translocase subunit SecF [Gemmatimonadaceae bacterium]|nr:protein translocase subunit SecF [Gemmatimonadaceae bacterium]
MIRIFHNTRYDFIKWWRHAAIATVVFIAIGLGSFIVTGGVNYSIEFTGGTLMQLEFKQPPDVAELRATVDKVAPGAEIQQFGTNLEYTLRARLEGAGSDNTSTTEGIARKIQQVLTEKYGAEGFTVKRTEAVGPKVGSELRRGAIVAMLLVSLVTLVYLAFRFEWRFGAAAVLSTAHDVLVTFAFIKIFHIEVSLVVVGAILTLLGYSGNDTIIIFDRVREDLRKARKEPLIDTLNRAINETLPRSILTHTTTLSATAALLIFAGEVLRPFAWVMFFGVFVATFSSIYVAGPLLLYIERKFPRSVTDKAHAVPAAVKAESKGENTPERPARPSGASRGTQRPATR